MYLRAIEANRTASALSTRYTAVSGTGWRRNNYEKLPKAA